MPNPYPSTTWIPKIGLVIVAYDSGSNNSGSGKWKHYGTFSHIGPRRELHKDWRWCAVTLRSDGSVQIAYKPAGKHNWEIQE